MHTSAPVLAFLAGAWCAAGAVNAAADAGARDWLRDQEQRQKSVDLLVHNPHGVVVREVHMVQSTHFDGGCKTKGCSVRLLPGEPDLCSNNQEPYAYHILNRWFDQYFLQAVAYANASRGRGALG